MKLRELSILGIGINSIKKRRPVSREEGIVYIFRRLLRSATLILCRPSSQSNFACQLFFILTQPTRPTYEVEFKFDFTTTMSRLGDILAEIDLEQYLRIFEEAGFDTWESLSTITENELATLGIPRGHRRRLQREVARRSGWPENRPLPGYNSASSGQSEQY